MLLAIKLFLTNLIKFVAEHIQEILLLLLCAMMIFIGTLYEGYKKDQEIAQIKQDFVVQQNLRTAEINDQVAKIQKDANNLADQLRLDLAGAKANANGILAKYNAEKKQKADRIALLELQVEQMKKDGKMDTKEFASVEKELTGLKMIYKISDLAVQTINKLVEEYSK